MVACAGVGELSDAEDGLFGNPDVGRPGEGTVVLGRPIKFGLGDVKAETNGDREIMRQFGVVRLKLKTSDLCHWRSLRAQGLPLKDPLKTSVFNKGTLLGLRSG